MQLTIVVGLLFIASVGYIVYYIYVTVMGIYNIKKETKIIEPKPSQACPENEENYAGLCYTRCREGYKRVLNMCVPDVYGVGAGEAVGLEPCRDGFVNDGLTCRKPIGWNNECVWWGFWWTGCATGGEFYGRLNNGGVCSADREKVSGMCYAKCPAGQNRMNLEPWHCVKPGVGSTYWTEVGKIPGCPAGQVKSGLLCYEDPGPGWTVTLGVAAKNCEAGQTDIGLFCMPSATNTPWYLSLYMLATAILITILCVVYFRYGMRNPAMMMGGNRKRPNKK
jgi:hypothetical protein